MPLSTFGIRDLCHLTSHTAALTALIAAVGLTPETTFAFGGMPSSGACTDFFNQPQDFARHRQGTVTYRISNNFKARYPDDFSQYLVRDVAELWEEYIGGVTQWNQDIADRFSYFRRDPSSTVYELKSVLAHEFGHAIGMQHSDACFYNNNAATNMPYNLNFRTSGGVFSVQATIGPEIMNEVPTASSPGVKASGAIDGYFRTPGRDALEFAGAANPFQSVDLVETNANSQLLLVDSTDAAQSGGQVTVQQTTDISPSDPQQGRFFDQLNLWIGNNIGLRSRFESWNIENFTGFDIRQITLRVDGTSTVRAMWESAPPFFTNFGASRQASPEQVIFGWSTPPAGPWPPMASGLLSLRADVHDWTIAEALMWANSNQAFPLAVPYYEPQTPWPFATPNTPSPQSAPQYTADPSLPPEPTPVPDEIELIPPATDIGPGTVRGFTAVIPMADGVEIERFEILALDWPEAELVFRLSETQRVQKLTSLFDERKDRIRNLKADGFAQKYLKPAVGRQTSVDAMRKKRKVLSSWVDVDLPTSQTYAVRLVVSNPYARVSSIAVPEDTAYLGSQIARCEIASNAAYCCPAEVERRIELGYAKSDVGHPWTSAHLREPTCIVGGERDEVVSLGGKIPHFLTLGGGNDKVRVLTPGSVVLLGGGDDLFEADMKAMVNVRGGRGNDVVKASERADFVNGGDGDDKVDAFGGNDVINLGAGDDYADAGQGDDVIYPGSGNDNVNAGEGDDDVVYLHVCELDGGARVSGGGGSDRLILPTTKTEAVRLGLRFDGFETIVEGSTRASLFADCEQ